MRYSSDLINHHPLSSTVVFCRPRTSTEHLSRRPISRCTCRHGRWTSPLVTSPPWPPLASCQCSLARLMGSWPRWMHSIPERACDHEIQWVYSYEYSYELRLSLESSTPLRWYTMAFLSLFLLRGLGQPVAELPHHPPGLYPIRQSCKVFNPRGTSPARTVCKTHNASSRCTIHVTSPQPKPEMQNP